MDITAQARRKNQRFKGEKAENELGIGVAPFDLLGRGFLKGKIDGNTTFDRSDFCNVVPRFTPETRKANQSLIDLPGKTAEHKRLRLRRSRSHGCWPRSRRSRPSQAPPSCKAWTGTSALRGWRGYHQNPTARGR
jgi:hypothetical protein